MCSAAEGSLQLHFLNVGDGDAVLVEELGPGNPFRLLVDTGRAEVGSFPGSFRDTVAAHLRRRGITSLDALVITHLHVDHFGGLALLLPRVTFRDVYAGFIPVCPAQRIPRSEENDRTVEKLTDCLNQWSELCEALLAAGSHLHQVDRTVPLPSTGLLQGEIICPSEETAAFQRAAWTGMLAGEDVPPGMKHWSAKYRNPGSLRVRLTYAGRAIELAGDCYGAAWESQAMPCDLLKVPHHGDAKALTAPLAARLSPAYGVISCGAEYIPRKDRPSRATAELLKEQGTRLFFTDCFSACWHQPEFRQSVDFTIQQNGEIQSPGRQT